jgi:hypothetical protein
MQTNLKFEKFFLLTKLGFRNIVHADRTALSKLHVDTSGTAKKSFARQYIFLRGSFELCGLKIL